MMGALLGVPVRTVPSTFEEDLDRESFDSPELYAEENAKQKAIEVYERLLREEGTPPGLVVGADTIVVLDDRILEKPRDAAHATEVAPAPPLPPLPPLPLTPELR